MAAIWLLGLFVGAAHAGILSLYGSDSLINFNDGARLTATCGNEPTVERLEPPSSCVASTTTQNIKVYLRSVPYCIGVAVTTPCVSFSPSYPPLFVCSLTGDNETINGTPTRANATAVTAPWGEQIGAEVYVSCDIPSLYALKRAAGIPDASGGAANYTVMVQHVAPDGSFTHTITFSGLPGGDRVRCELPVDAPSGSGSSVSGAAPAESFGVAVANESSSTATRWYTMNVSGVDYRFGEFLNDGQLVLSQRGTADFWMGSSGGNGAGSGGSAWFQSGGQHGGILELPSIVMEPGTYTVEVGDADRENGMTRISGPFPAPTTGYSCGRYTYASGYDTTVGWSPTGNVQSAPPVNLYTRGVAQGGAQAGRAGYGGSSGGTGGGPAGEVAGWTETPFMWGKGGGGRYGPPPQPDNSGNGGDGSEWSSYGKGGSGRFYIRMRI